MHILFAPLFAGVMVVLLSTCHLSLGQDRDKEMKELREENIKLREEVALLKKEKELLKEELKGMRGDSTESKANRPEGEINGIIWEITGYRPNGTELAVEKFLAAEGKIYFDNKEIGIYSENGNKARLDITRSPNDRANGVYELLRTSNNPTPLSWSYEKQSRREPQDTTPHHQRLMEKPDLTNS